MNRFLPVACALLALGGCAAKPVAAVATAPAAPVRAADWPRADAAAAASGDSLEVRLVAWLRALAPGASAADIARVLTESPEFPNRPVLEARYGAALAGLGSDADAEALCTTTRPTGPEGLARCAAAARASGDATRAAEDAAAAWRAGAVRDPAAERAFLAAFAGALSAADTRARFATLLGAGAREAARRAALLLPEEDRPLAFARLALAEGGVADPRALYASVPPPGDADPPLVLGVARALRRGAATPDAALAFWRAHGFAAEQAEAGAGRPTSGFWTERDLLARALLDAGRAEDAFAVADDAAAAPETARADALFLAGWIALRKLGRPAIAAARFDALASLSRSIVTRARAAYWQARAADAAGDAEAAHRHDLAAAAFPTTFYGQRALGRLGDGDALAARLAAIPEPAPNEGQAFAFASEEMPRAALLLAAWGQAPRARAFIDVADRTGDAPPTRHVLAARLALRLGLPDEAVVIARRAARSGLALPQLGWPRPYAPPPPAPAALMLGLMRQESGFDPGAVSPSGAVGLTQLLPGTAADMARAAGLPRPSVARLTADPTLNMQLGSAYLDGLLARFGARPAAVAAYNAGPHRVAGWPACPSSSLDDPATVDWIEAIPVAETRNYVERVLENAAIYAARSPVPPAVATLGAAQHA